MSEYFKPHELACKHCGRHEFKQSTLDRLNELRRLYNKPITLSSAYRCPEANIAGGYTQTHSTGQAVDIVCNGSEAFELVRLAILCKFTGIGISQRSGKERFIHLDDLLDVQVKRLNGSAKRPAMWSY